MKTLLDAKIDSDHNLLVAEVQTRLKAIKKKLGRGNQREFGKNQENQNYV